MKKSPLLLFLLILIVGISFAAIYKWVDEQGRTHYTETPPPGEKAKQVDLPPSPPKEVLEEAQQRLEKIRKDLERGTQVQEVLGTIALGFVPTPLARLPQPPIHITLVIRPVDGEGEYKFRIKDPSPGWEVQGSKAAVTLQNFTVFLRPGKYKITALDVVAPSLADKPITLITVGPNFTVPAGNCGYIGRISYNYIRLPPGTYQQATEAVKIIVKEQGRGQGFLYLTKGSILFPPIVAVDSPSPAERETARKGGRQLLEEARKKKCSMEFARF